MANETIELWAKEEYTYPVHGSFIPTITTYIHDDPAIRPAMIVVPGGGYTIVSPAEAEIVARKFCREGFNAFVLTYTINTTQMVPLKLQPLMDLSKAVVLVRKEHARFKIDSQKVVVCGFSAGGHLTASLAIHHGKASLQPTGEFKGISNRPDAIILSYPVITSGQDAHRSSLTALLGEDATDAELQEMSLEKWVTPNMPPAFIWQTADDASVPAENSLLFANACKKAGVQFEYHLFSQGPHGISTADENWENANFGEFYTVRQMYEETKYAIENGIGGLLPPFDAIKQLGSFEEFISIIKQFFKIMQSTRRADESVALWLKLAVLWVGKTLG